MDERGPDMTDNTEVMSEGTSVEATPAPEVTNSTPETSTAPQKEVATPVKEATPAPSKSIKEKIQEASKELKKAEKAAPKPASKPDEGSEEAPLAVVPAPFTPNLKVKVMDKEFDIDAFIKDAIKDKDQEKKIREIYEKAIGFDFAKPKHLELKNQYEQFQKGFQSLGGMLQENRLEEFLEFWKIPKNKLYEYVASQLRYEDLTPEQKAEEDRKRHLETTARTVQEQNAYLQQQYHESIGANRARDLDTELSREDIAAVVAEFDSRRGTPGAFRQAVINRGRTAAALERKDLSVSEAIREVMGDLGYVEGNAPEPAVPQQVVPTAPKKLPTLPNLGSGGASPVMKSIKSISELRAIGKQMRES